MTTSADRLWAVALLLLWALLTLWRYWHSWSADLSAVYFAALFYHTGDMALIYPDGSEGSALVPAAWHALAAAQGHGGALLTPYIYPPLWAALLAPLAAALSPLAFFDLFRVVHIAALAASVLAAAALARPERLALRYWVLISLALLQLTTIGQLALELNQPQILATLLILLAFTALSRGYVARCGAWLALAAALKITPAFLALVLVMNRAWRALAAFVVVGAALACASLLIAGPELHLAMRAAIARLNGLVLLLSQNASVEPVLWQFVQVARGTANWQTSVQTSMPRPGWLALVAALLLVGFTWLGWLRTRGLPARTQLWLRLMICSLILPLFTPLGWLHHLMVPLLLLPGLFTLLPRATAAMLLLAFTGVMSTALWSALLLATGSIWAAMLLNSFGTLALLLALLMLLPRSPAHA